MGSIGVISAGFGFTGLIDKIGVERRVYTAGANKDTLDPFLPEKPADVKRIKAIQQDVHAAFIDLVKSSRGDKLTKADKELFTGEFWSGKTAAELGLAHLERDQILRQRDVREALVDGLERGQDGEPNAFVRRAFESLWPYLSPDA